MINLHRYLNAEQVLKCCENEGVYDLAYLVKHASERPIEDGDGYVCEICSIVSGSLKLISGRYACLRCRVDLESPYDNYTKRLFSPIKN